MGSFHTSIEDVVQPKNENKIQIKYPDNINNQKISSIHPNSPVNTG